jgi:hypothetical protein
LRNEFQGTGHEALMDLWSHGGEQAVRNHLDGNSGFVAFPEPELVPSFLPHSYAFLDTAKTRMRSENP